MAMQDMCSYLSRADWFHWTRAYQIATVSEENQTGLVSAAPRARRNVAQWKHFCQLPRFFRPTALMRLVIYITTLFFMVTLIYVFCMPSPNTRSRLELKPPAPVNNTPISYENHTLAAEEAKRVGPGEQGLPLELTPEEDERYAKYRYQNAFNIYVSSLISVDRSVRDIRHPTCKTMRYAPNLPTVSIILPVFEEDWNALLRTFRSAIKRAPPGLIKEVILSDDGSTRPFLKAKLDNYLSTTYPDGLVRVIRSPARGGLIDARIRGALVATGDVLVFLDSHCETAPNWLPPLLDPIKKDYRTVTNPLIDIIDGGTFEFKAQTEGVRGLFSWKFSYMRGPKLAADSPYPERPFPTPIMEGGLFAISAKWFWELGGYDPGLKIWGGEQYEISFKIWMCGGRMLNVPCSRIGHIYRKYRTNFPKISDSNFLGRNYIRVAEVWMDEYKKFIYDRNPHFRAINPGNLTVQHAVRERLQCKSFKWFLNEVAPDLEKRFPTIEPTPMARGDIRPLLDHSMCIDSLHGSKTQSITLKKCIREGARGNQGVQDFEISYRNEARAAGEENCWDSVASSPLNGVKIYPCHGDHGNQEWKLRRLDVKAGVVLILHTASNKCLEVNVNPHGESIVLMPCDTLKDNQKWIWQHVEPEKR